MPFLLPGAGVSTAMPPGGVATPHPKPAHPELECLRGALAPGLLMTAAAHADARGVGADRVLIAEGIIDEEAYLRRLAQAHGVAFETFAEAGNASCPLADDRLLDAAANGLLPLRYGRNLVWVVAPRGHAAAQLARLLAASPGLASRLRLTTARRLNEFIRQRGHDAWAHHAAEQLRTRRPDLSAAPRRGTLRWWPLLLGASLFAAGAMFYPAAVFETAAALLAVWFLAFIGLRLAASAVAKPVPARLSRLPDECLPVYTVVAALYHEAESVPGLVAALRQLDYPAEKLDIKLAVEPDDLETRAAIARLGSIPTIEVIIAPSSGPRTKPKALNAALPFARGTFTVIYDAEDRPEPGQLRAALDAFRSEEPDVACAQASLCIDNPADSWLARMFTAEYAGQFDVFLPGFASFRLPLPLGGSSNHFRTAVLRDVMGWDAYNVTEDADLGVRLARCGYRSVTFASTTYEEAPAQFGAWLRQRTRWMKGWLQTWAVHMRAPRMLWREIGARGFLTLNIAIGGNVLTALVHPFFVGAMIYALATQAPDAQTWLTSGPFAWLHALAIGSGYITAMLIGWIGLSRRKLRRSAWVLAMIPVYWLLLSVAAWRALHQLLTHPYRWEKTQHGLARSSHFMSRNATHAADAVTDNVSDRSTVPRSAA